LTCDLRFLLAWIRSGFACIVLLNRRPPGLRFTTRSGGSLRTDTLDRWNWSTRGRLSSKGPGNEEDPRNWDLGEEFLCIYLPEDLLTSFTSNLLGFLNYCDSLDGFLKHSSLYLNSRSDLLRWFQVQMNFRIVSCDSSCVFNDSVYSYLLLATSLLAWALIPIQPSISNGSLSLFLVFAFRFASSFAFARFKN
jgi:hypothetical protein